MSGFAGGAKGKQMRLPIKFVSDGGFGSMSEEETADVIKVHKMKRDATESLTTIRDLCEDLIYNDNWGKLHKEFDQKRKDDPSLGRNLLNIIAQIQWICRHALEDYDVPPDVKDPVK
jgi:hypothetical protein